MVRLVLAGRAVARVALASLCVVVCGAVVGVGPAVAGGCANEQVRALEPYAGSLPDCRAYEQVTPINKDGTDPTGEANAVQDSPTGDRVTFLVPANMPGGVGANGLPSFLASRGSEGWSSKGLLLPTVPGFASKVLDWTEDLTTVALEGTTASFSRRSLYMLDSATGSYSRIAGEGYEIHVADFTPDGKHMIFETQEQLLPNAAPEKSNLYEWDASTSQLSLVGVLPGSGEVAPPWGSFAGPNAWALADASTGGAEALYYTQNTISKDGSRIFFTARETGQLYERENGSRTVAIPGGHFDAATPDGRKVLVDDGGTLSQYDTASETETGLTPPASEVQGVLGMSDDGSYVYFVANAVLAANTDGLGGQASPGDCNNAANAGGGEGTCNLYVRHFNGTEWSPPIFVAHLNSVAGSIRDSRNWYPTPVPNQSSVEPHEKTSRVTPDGKTLLFGSHLQQTGYDNSGSEEFYRYDAERPVSGSNPVCVSCDPSGAPPARNAALRSMIQPSVITGGGATTQLLTRNLSTDGRRFVFESPDPLVTQDTNGVQDVYEWEASGEGACRSSGESFGGCIHLVSSGRSPNPSYFGDASVNGENIFFFTYQPLVAQDQDQLVDLYDARVDGGIASQNALAQEPCASEGCRGGTGSPPVFGAPSSATFSGSGNLAPPVVKTKPAPTTRAHKPAKHVARCPKKPQKKRKSCVKHAGKRSGGASKVKKSNGRGK